MVPNLPRQLSESAVGQCLQSLEIGPAGHGRIAGGIGIFYRPKNGGERLVPLPDVFGQGLYVAFLPEAAFVVHVDPEAKSLGL